MPRLKCIGQGWRKVVTLGAALMLLGQGICAAQAAAPATAEIDWRSLRVLDLLTAQRIALQQNPDLSAAAQRVAQASERVRQAQAAYWPTLNAESSANRLNLSNNATAERRAQARLFDPGAKVDDTDNIYRAGLSSGWTVFDGFRREYDNALARYGSEASQAAYDEARRLLLTQVADSFYLAQLARENSAIAQADEAFNARQVTDALARERVGTGSLSDVLNFKVQVNAARSARIRFEREYRVAVIGLAALMGLPEAGLPETVNVAGLNPETEAELAIPEPSSNIGYAFENRTDIKRDEFVVNQREAGIGLARSAFWPSLQFQASLDGERTGSVDMERDDFGTTVGLFMTYPLFEGGLRRARLAEAKYQRREAEDQLAGTRLTVASEVREAIARVRNAQEELQLQQSNAALVQQNRDLVEKEYRAGQASLVRLNEAQRNLTQAQSQLALARVGLRQTLKNLDAATGRILLPFQSQ
jgi:outer membrane protein TolC